MLLGLSEMYLWQILQTNCEEEIEMLWTNRRWMFDPRTLHHVPIFPDEGSRTDRLGHESFPRIGKESVTVEFPRVTFRRETSWGVAGEDRVRATSEL
ncbi:hypothetical protein CEXT_785801 [Caerostris extrusa]|uniref:Uncharacterized protein n=1 Tax=Caerostris extrusa TaxID=172846 RepID=A0AAV4TTA4_CAEEX|nr:hypothetical protein CEXT_785801 [Caerostris extrusa]